MPYPCFLLAPVPQIKFQLQRYTMHGASGSWTCAAGWHNAFAPLAIVDHPLKEQPWMCESWTEIEDALRPAKEDPRWPRKCSCCSYEFQEQDEWQLFTDRLMARSDGGGLTTIRDAPVGAMWFAWWYRFKDANSLYGHEWDNQTGPNLIVKTPGGEWNIDGRARNCTLPKDRLHRCWVRHGFAPKIHVDKNGRTCSAGAGSIICGKYHGFLRNGSLTDGC